MKFKTSNHLYIAQSLTQLLDNQFRIGKFRFGLDPLLGLIPGMGDFIGFGLGLYIYWIGINIKIPKSASSQMLRNLVLDLIIGSVPVIGELWDFTYKANVKNLAILKNYIPDTPKDAEIVK